MTDPTREPSSEEVEAAAKAMVPLDMFSVLDYRDIARAALTAAAQVREGVPSANMMLRMALEEIAQLPDVSADEASIVAKSALAAVDALRSSTEDTTPATNNNKGLSPKTPAEGIAHSDTTEPDSGPSVLGNEE